MAGHGPNRKVANSLVALSSAAIMAVYAAGYVRTRRAAERFDLEVSARKRLTAPPSAARPSTAPPSLSPPFRMPASSASAEPTRFTPGAQAAPHPTAAPRSSAPPIDRTPVAPAPAGVGSPARSTSLESPKPISSPGVSPTPTPASPASAPATPAAPSSAPPVQPTTAEFEEPMEGDEVSEAANRPSDHYKDGTFTGWGTCRHGDIQVELVIRAGRIAWASIAKCYTRYPCDMLERLTPEVVGQQGPPLTFVSGASESSDAFYYAVLDALSKAK